MFLHFNKINIILVFENVFQVKNAKNKPKYSQNSTISDCENKCESVRSVGILKLSGEILGQMINYRRIDHHNEDFDHPRSFLSDYIDTYNNFILTLSRESRDA